MKSKILTFEIFYLYACLEFVCVELHSTDYKNAINFKCAKIIKKINSLKFFFLENEYIPVC